MVEKLKTPAVIHCLTNVVHELDLSYAQAEKDKNSKAMVLIERIKDKTMHLIVTLEEEAGLIDHEVK